MRGSPMTGSEPRKEPCVGWSAEDGDRVAALGIDQAVRSSIGAETKVANRPQCRKQSYGRSGREGGVPEGVFMRPRFPGGGSIFVISLASTW